MSNITIKRGDYVVATKDINDIQERSVGLVGDVLGEKLTVFFIGANKIVEINSNYVAYLDIEKTGKPYKKKICNICHLLKNDLE
ncbi:MAG: endonuclease, partial [Desulfamplus sp.]|nr:endonuclease [Desulfamplus sp.]